MAGHQAVLDINEASNLLKGVTIPPRPRLLRDIGDVYPDIRKVSAIISTDQGVTAGVLRAVNSPLYALGRKISSVERAVVLLGLQSVLNIVNALFLRAALGSANPMPELNDYWQSTTDVGIACAALSKHLHLGLDEHAYLTGLFHNCGIPLMLRRFPGYMSVMEESYLNGTLGHLEDQRLGTHHAVVGSLVAHYWKLPETVCLAIREHHQPEGLFQNPQTNSETALLVAILKIAEHASQLPLRIGHTDIDREWLAQANSLRHFLGQSVSALTELVQLASAEIEENAMTGYWPRI